MSAKRHPNETCRLREIHVVEFLMQLVRKQFGDLVLKALPLLVRERQIARIGANSQHFWIDQLDRQVGVVHRLLLRQRRLPVRGQHGGHG
jgi:hypothetical protein